MSAETASVLSGPINGTIAALKAHRSRWAAKSGKEAAAKVAEYDQRIAAIMARVAMPAALPAPASEPEQPQPVPVPETSGYALSTAIEPETPAEPEKPTAPVSGDGDQVARSATRRGWTRSRRRKELTRFVADINSILGREHGLTVSQLAEGVPVETWFDAGMSPEQAAARCQEWRRPADGEAKETERELETVH